jgi:hypothetical protein
MSDDLAVELLYHGKLLDRNRNEENVLNDIPVALCQLEEGLVEVDGLKPWQRYVCIYTYIYMCKFSHVCTNTCVCVCMYVCICIYTLCQLEEGLVEVDGLKP